MSNKSGSTMSTPEGCYSTLAVVCRQKYTQAVCRLVTMIPWGCTLVECKLRYTLGECTPTGAVVYRPKCTQEGYRQKYTQVVCKQVTMNPKVYTLVGCILRYTPEECTPMYTVAHRQKYTQEEYRQKYTLVVYMQMVHLGECTLAACKRTNTPEEYTQMNSPQVAYTQKCTPGERRQKYTLAVYR